MKKAIFTLAVLVMAFGNAGFAQHKANLKSNATQNVLKHYGVRNETTVVPQVATWKESETDVFRTTYEYDEYDQPVSSTLYDYNENDYEPELTITLYEYRYDDNGNWVTREEYQVDNDKKVLTSIVERDIKYYAN